jgi:AcrR family transcriptional regulator
MYALQRMPRPRSLTTRAIAEAALAVLERRGLEGLSMRAVAGELGVGTMSLYRYVRSREELEGLVVERVLATIDLDDLGPDVPWAERVATMCERVRDAVGAHPATVPLLLVGRHRIQASLRWGEAMLGALADGGITGADRVIAFRTLLAFVLGAAQVEHLGPLSGEGTVALSRLPTDRFPHLATTASDARHVPPADEFRRGLHAVMAGLGIPLPPQ